MAKREIFMVKSEMYDQFKIYMIKLEMYGQIWDNIMWSNLIRFDQTQNVRSNLRYMIKFKYYVNI